MFIPHKLILRNIMSYPELEYTFKNKQAIIIIGENKEDPGQKSNGSGKSGIAEGISLAVTGSTIRNIKTKEVVRRGCEYGEVEWHLYNTMYRCEIKIWRRIHVNKSAEYALYENGELQSMHYSDFNTFNSFVFHTLGISKEDFFNFYLMTAADYKPFFRTGDIEKKKIINRFSGADKVDAAIPFVEEDVEEKQDKVRLIEKEITKVKGKQEFIVDQIKAEEGKYSEEGKKERLKEINKKIHDEVASFNEYQEDYVSDCDLLEKEKKELESLDKVTLSEQIKEYEDAIVDGEMDYNKLSRVVEKLSDKETEALKFKRELENGLAGLITCPNCSHKFLLNNKDFNIEEAEAAIKEIDSDILPDTRKKLQEKSAAALEIKGAIKEAREELKKLQKQEEEHEKLKRTCRKNIGGLESSIQKLEKWIQQSKEKVKELEEEKRAIQLDTSLLLQGLNESLLLYIDEETEWRERLQQALNEKAEVEKWNVNFKNFKSFLANKSIKNIEDYTNLYLESMGTNISIKIDGYRVLSNKKIKEEITTEVLRNGFSIGSYGSFSAGERGRIDIAVILAIQSLINLNSTTGGLDLCICDEILDSVDSLGLEHIVGALQNVGRTIMIVSQNEINALNNYTLTIRKENGISKIV